MALQSNQKRALEEKLWEAAAAGDSAVIRMLAAQGVDVDARNPDGFTAFSLATQHGHHNTALTVLAARNLRHFGRMGIAPAYEEGETINPLRVANQNQN